MMFASPVVHHSDADARAVLPGRSEARPMQVVLTVAHDTIVMLGPIDNGDATSPSSCLGPRRTSRRRHRACAHSAGMAGDADPFANVFDNLTVTTSPRFVTLSWAREAVTRKIIALSNARFSTRQAKRGQEQTDDDNREIHGSHSPGS
jgi:hypothetical protein